MENTPINNVTYPVTQIEPPVNNQATDSSASQQKFYNNYPKQPGTVAYNVPSYTPGAQQQPIYRSAPAANNQSPSAIYRTNQTGNAPQYHYGNPTASGILNNTYLQEQQIIKQQNKMKSKTLRALGNFAGLALIVCFLRSNFEGLVLALIPGMSSFMLSSFGGMMFMNLLLSISTIGGTFLALHFILKVPKDKITKEKKYASTIKLNAPKKPLKALLLIPVSFGGCMVANYIVSFIAAFFSSIGVESGYDSFDNPASVAETVVMFIAIAVIPPLIEEFAMRGVLLSSMQKYGNAFAMFATAFMFGLFHGNFTQIPFAFICGLFFAYITIATDSLWPAIIVHAMNNGMSCISTALLQYTDEATTNIFYYSASIGGIVLGIICLIIYLVLYRKERILKAPSKIPDFSTAKKFRKFMSSPGMIFATIFYTFQAILLAVASSLTDLI